MTSLIQQTDTGQTGRAMSLGLYIGIAILVWLVSLVIYRLYLSPVAHIPGPKLAAATFWYEFYFDVVKDGSYTWKIKSLHEQYGPIVRINPCEVHVNDPAFYDQVYVSTATRKTDKWSFSVNVFPSPGSVVTTVAHDLHRHRRAMLSFHFSTAAIQRLEPLIREKVNKLIQRLGQASKQQEVVSMSHAYPALAVDVITSYTFAESWDFLEAADFSPELIQMSYKFSPLSHWNKHFPQVISLLVQGPKLLEFLSGRKSEQVDPKRDFVRKAEEMKASRAEELEKQGAGSTKDAESIFQAMINADVPESEKATDRLAIEANTLVMAGLITTQHTMETITYHLTANKTLRDRLFKELRSAKMNAEADARVPDSVGLTLRTLERLPYLTAVIREGLRVSYGIPQRLPRVSPDTVLQYENYQLPPGTPVSMSALMMHENEEIFPDALSFKPERWLPLDTVGQSLNRYLVPFSKGSRQCAGMNLAMAELYLTIAAVFGNYKLELHEVDFERDIKVVRDHFNPLPSSMSKGLRVTVGSCESS